MAETVRFGTVFFYGEPQEVGAEYNGEIFTIGDTVPGKEIPWVKLKSGLLVAKGCVCTNISWDELNEITLVFGVVVVIDKKAYICRCLKVGEEQGAPNEWDDALNETGESPATWNCSTYFWGQERSKDNSAFRAVRGLYSSRHWECLLKKLSTDSFGFRSVGFRPVLEPLEQAPVEFDGLVGKELTVVGPDLEYLTGKLAAVSDYDLVLETDSPLPQQCEWAVEDGGQLICARDEIGWIKKR